MKTVSFSPSLEVEFELSRDVHGFIAAICFPPLAFAFTKPFKALVSFSSFIGASGSASISLPFDGSGRCERVLGVNDDTHVPNLSLRFNYPLGSCRATSCLKSFTLSASAPLASKPADTAPSAAHVGSVAELELEMLGDKACAGEGWAMAASKFGPNASCAAVRWRWGKCSSAYQNSL